MAFLAADIRPCVLITSYDITRLQSMDNLVSQNSWLLLYGPVTIVTVFVSDHDCIISDHAIRLKLGI